jgi:hypothetical protein
MWSMRRLILRRSVSSWVSPGPRVPLPPPSCDMARPRPARRGSWYSSCASSTWSWPSRVLAWRAKMSRMSCERSMTWQGSRDSMLRSCEGVRSWSKRTSEALVEATTSTISSSLPWPTRLEGSGLWRRWTSVTAMVAPADRASSSNSARLVSKSRVEAAWLGSSSSPAMAAAVLASRVAAVSCLRLRRNRSPHSRRH